MARRSGSFLEGSVVRLFKLAGFEPKRNVKLHGYEIDVFVKYKTHDIIIECKQRDRGGLVVRNLIHEWHSKNELIRASRVVLAITGVDINKNAYDLAKKYGIIIWDETKLEKLIDEAVGKTDRVKEKLLREMNLESVEKTNKEPRKDVPAKGKAQTQRNTRGSYAKALIFAFCFFFLVCFIGLTGSFINPVVSMIIIFLMLYWYSIKNGLLNNRNESIFLIVFFILLPVLGGILYLLYKIIRRKNG